VLFSNIVFRIPSLFLYALGKNRQYSLFSLADAFINLSLSVILARYFDIKGVVLATLIATCLTSVPSNLFFFRKAFNSEIRFYQCIQPVLVPLLLALPVLIGCYFAAPLVTSFLNSWLMFGASVLLFNILLISLLLIINYRKLSLFLKDFKFLNDGVYG
jgi:O-antigen/teichoic acid export membrane protein